MWILDQGSVFFVTLQNPFPVEIYNLVHVCFNAHKLFEWSNKIPTLFLILTVLSGRVASLFYIFKLVIN